MRGEGRSVSEGGRRCARVYACRVWGGTERTRSYKVVGSVTSGSGSGSVSVVGGGVGERAVGESEGEGVSSCDESGLRANKLKTIV